TFAQRSPVVVAGLSAPLELAAGGEHTCARVVGDTVLCWGAGAKGQLGQTAAARPRPAPVPRLTGALDLALGEAHSCALQRTGNITCWGSDEHRALGPRRLRLTCPPGRVLRFMSVCSRPGSSTAAAPARTPPPAPRCS